jgi:hypothetical protein
MGVVRENASLEEVMKNYIVLEFIDMEGWVFDTSHATKEEAEDRIRELIEAGIPEDHIKLFADLSWKVRTKDKQVHKYERGRWGQ